MWNNDMVQSLRQGQGQGQGKAEGVNAGRIAECDCFEITVNQGIKRLNNELHKQVCEINDASKLAC